MACHGSKLLILGMVTPPLIGNPYNEYMNPHHSVDDHLLLNGNNGEFRADRTYKDDLPKLKKLNPEDCCLQGTLY